MPMSTALPTATAPHPCTHHASVRRTYQPRDVRASALTLPSYGVPADRRRTTQWPRHHRTSHAPLYWTSPVDPPSLPRTHPVCGQHHAIDTEQYQVVDVRCVPCAVDE